MVISEKSCGVVAFREENGSRKYLVIQSLRGAYGFPKGHVEQGETEQETALRELKEETHIDALLLDGFRHEITYPLPGSAHILKQVVFFLGESADGEPVRQASEVRQAKFVSFEEALTLLTFENFRKILMKAESFLQAQRSTQHGNN